MTFLALSPFGAILLTLIVASAVIALHFLKIRPHRVFVSSAVLWQRVLGDNSSRSLWERLQRIVSILLAVTIALLIALSIGRPQTGAVNGKMRRIVIVLDTSPTMNARTSDGSTRWKHATEKARALLAESPAAEFRIADTSGQTAFPFTPDRTELLKFIDRLAPSNVQPHFPNVAAGATVYLISDGVALEDVPQDVERFSVFERADNIGITAFDVRPVPSRLLEYEAYLEIQNYGRPAEIRLTLRGTDQERIARSLRLLTDARFRETFDLSNFHGGRIQASIETKNDAFPIDDTASALVPPQRKIRTVLVTPGNEYLETLLKLDRSVELVTANPQNYREPPDIDALVFDRFAPQTAPSKPALIIGAPRAPWLPTPNGIVQKPQISAWSASHPILRHVAAGEVSIERANRIDSQNLDVVAGSKETPLIVVSKNPQWLMLTFDLGSSNFPLQNGFPIFIENVLAWFNREQIALGRSPEKLANPNLSNINRSIFTAPASTQRAVWFRRELWFYMIVSAVALIALEWFTYHRGITL